MERARIAAEIHDDVVQQLVFIKHRVTTPGKTESWGGNGDSLRVLTSAIDRTIASMERICRGLTPLDLRQFGLTLALRILFREHSDEGFRVRAKLADIGKDLDRAKALALFRIVQESLTNARRHSGAKEVSVMLTKGFDWIRVEVRDDGVGFELGAASSGRGMGLLGMSERAAMLGGVFKVRSTRGKGTRVSLRLPVGEWTRTEQEG